MVYCLSLKTGEVLWKHEAHTGKPQIPRHPKSTYAAETPTTDGKRLYVLFGDVGPVLLRLRRAAAVGPPIEPKKTKLGYGAAASPVVQGDQVIMVYDNEEESYIAAIDSATGQTRWKALATKRAPGPRRSYGSTTAEARSSPPEKKKTVRIRLTANCYGTLTAACRC